MKLFSGFPAGKLQVTPLPNLFFTELCPAIDDLAELKLMLHLFWRLSQSSASRASGQPNKVLYVSAADLRADRTLMQSLSAVDSRPADALERALQRAAERGALLHLSVFEEQGDAAELYFMNTEAGRRAFEQLERDRAGYTPAPAPAEPASISARPNVFALYEQNIGLLTPMISEELKEAEQTYPAVWLAEAFKIAVENNKRSWSYVRKILERWRTEGRGEGTRNSKTWYGDEYGKFVKR